MKSKFESLAGYNGWANSRVYGAAEALPDALYRKEHGAFFGSIHRTLNHMLIGDWIWMNRFTGDGPAPRELDAVPFADFEDLKAARVSEDARIADYIGSLSEAAIDGTIAYRTISNPADMEQPLADALLHFFNHQTHHRGQVHCLLTQLGGSAPSLDLLVYQRGIA